MIAAEQDERFLIQVISYTLKRKHIKNSQVKGGQEFLEIIKEQNRQVPNPSWYSLVRVDTFSLVVGLLVGH